jgi:hypothetical protein
MDLPQHPCGSGKVGDTADPVEQIFLVRWQENPYFEIQRDASNRK